MLSSRTRRLAVPGPSDQRKCVHYSRHGSDNNSKSGLTADPVFAFAFLQRFIDVLKDYIGDISSYSLKENFDVVYQVYFFAARKLSKLSNYMSSFSKKCWMVATRLQLN